MNVQQILLGLCFTTVILCINSCAVNPATGTPDLVFMSESDEIAMGKEMHEKLLKSVPIYQDDKLSAYVDAIGQKNRKK
jgi:predicted Zn-dependent protease